ncbi:MAG: S-methyl-5-thioribose-1-phosphate isomerase [Gammaproteobacteria bacterium]|nr:S-methyl-5-thioribose-1-phosphate isomerase [Gammaproteobacteria bacterium]
MTLSSASQSRSYDRIRAVEWAQNQLKLLDQRGLPLREEYLSIDTVAAAALAIRNMAVRGAPAIGITAAYAVVLAARDRYRADPSGWAKAIEADLVMLNAARPTAVNLAWAIARMQCLIATGLAGDPVPRLLEEARHIHAEDITANQAMGRFGAALIAPGSSVLTHCNTGALATGGYGTALGVVRAGVADGRIVHTYADETRPWLQGARLTAWELVQERIPVTLLADSAAAYLMQQGKVQWVIVGADRITANGDVANKIGTYMGAIAARHHGVKFMVVAPISTIDPATATGADIHIEHRPAAEVLFYGDRLITAEGAQAWNPAFDVTPAGLVDVLVTERGVVQAPNSEKIAALLRS